MLKLSPNAPDNLLKMWGIGPFKIEEILNEGLSFRLQGLIPFLATRYQVVHFMDECTLKLVQPD